MKTYNLTYFSSTCFAVAKISIILSIITFMGIKLICNPTAILY